MRDLVVTHRLSRKPDEYRVLTPAARVALQLTAAGVELRPGEMLRFLYVPGPEKVRAWDGDLGDQTYDVGAYVELLTRAVESVLAPVGVDRATLDMWLLGQCGYWGPPGVLPPLGEDIRFPLLARPMPQLARSEANLSKETTLDFDVAPPEAIPLAVDYKTPIRAG